MNDLYLEFSSKTVAESWAASLGLSVGDERYSVKHGAVAIVDFQVVVFNQKAILFVWVVDRQGVLSLVRHNSFESDSAC